MSFSMKQIKRNTTNKKQDMSEFSKQIYSLKIISPNVDIALWEYVKYRLFKRKHSSFTPEFFKQMIIKLLEYVMSKNFNEITEEDVINNERQIIYEIACAIYYGNIHSLYLDNNEIFRSNINNMPKLVMPKAQINKDDIEEYFKNIMI